MSKICFISRQCVRVISFLFCFIFFPSPSPPTFFNCLVKIHKTIFFSPPAPDSSPFLQCLGGLHEDAVVSAELQDLPQSLLGCGHAFFGPFAFCGLIADWWRVRGVPLGGVQRWRH